MKTKRYIQILILALFLIPLTGYSQQQDGLTWLRTYASTGFNTSPGFVSDTSGFLYLPVVFVDTVRFGTSGTTDTLVSAGDGDILLAKIETLTGNISQYRHFTSKAHLVVTDISMTDGYLILSGACRDSVFMIADTNDPQYLGGKTGAEKGFLLSMTTGGQFINFTIPAEEVYQSGLNIIKTEGLSLLACGTARQDTLSPLANLFILNKEGESTQTIIDSLTRTDIRDGVFFNQSAWVCGSFTDSLILNDTILYAPAGIQAFMAKADTGTFPLSDAITWRGYQDAFAAGMANFNQKLWVGINFSDSLIYGNGSMILSHGMADAVVLQYDSTLHLQHIYQFGGSYTERIDRLFVSDDRLYVLGNTASPDTKLWLNGQEKFTVTQAENAGIQTLLSIDIHDTARLEWTAQEGRLGRMTGVSKINASETIIAGVFNRQMIIDSTEFNPSGLQDVYLLRVADICLNRLKQTEMKFMFCKGDSVLISGAQWGSKTEIKADPDDGELYISQPGKYYIKSISDCGCKSADTLVFELIEPRDAEKKGFSNPGPVSQIFILSDESELKIRYCGECLEREKQATFRILPNPTSANSVLDVYLPREGTIRIKIVSAEGALVNRMEFQESEGSHQIDLQSGILKPGTYMVHTNYGDGFTNTDSPLILIKL
jgi:hypothetical protein